MIASLGALTVAPSTGLALAPAERSGRERIAMAAATTAARQKAMDKDGIFRAIAAEVERTGDKRIVMTRCKDHAARLQRAGFSALRLYNDYFAWQRGGRSIASLLPATTKARGMSAETKDFIHGWMTRNQRASKQGWRDFLDKHWRAGLPVPGLLRGLDGKCQDATWQQWFAQRWPHRAIPPVCPPDLPHGWTYENLMRRRPSDAELAAARQGVAAALNCLPPIPGTRADIRPLEYVTFDDVKFDFRVHCPDVGTPVDLVGLVGLDIGTACALGVGLRPVLLREDGSGEKLKRRDMKAQIVRLLQTWGWPDYGMTILLENGTATVGDDFAAAVFEATNGKVRIRHTEMLRGTVWAGGFADRAIGNSRGKSWLESFFNPMHNRLADLPGQTGRRYDVAPQDDHGRRAELKALVAAGKRIEPELRARLRMPYLSCDEARPEIAAALDALNRRHDHELKDFDDVLVWRFREGDPWMRREEMLDFAPEQLEHILTDTIKESPLWRLQRQSEGVVVHRLHESAVPALLEDQKWVRFERGEILLTWQKKDYVFSPYTGANLAVLEQLVDRTEYLAYFDGSQSIEAIYLTTGSGRYLGELRPGAVSRKDREAGGKAIETKRRLLKTVCDNVNRRSPEVAEENDARIQENLDTLANAGAITAAPRIGADGDGSAPSEVGEVIAGSRAAAARAAKVNPTKAAQQLTKLQAAKFSKEKDPAPEDESWA